MAMIARSRPAVTSFTRVLAAAWSVSILLAGAAFATYPERPVTLVVPFAAGGANDVVARIIQQPLADALGQPVVIENRGGAGGNIGFGYVARALATATRCSLRPTRSPST